MLQEMPYPTRRKHVSHVFLCPSKSNFSPKFGLQYGHPFHPTHKKSLTKPRPHPRPLSHGERGACFIKNKKPSPKPRPHPRPLSHGERGACFIKNKKPSPKPTKSLSPPTTPQASPPHEMRKGRAASPRGPFAFRGVWGDFVPPQKKLLRQCDLQVVDELFVCIIRIDKQKVLARIQGDLRNGHTARTVCHTFARLGRCTGRQVRRGYA